MARPNPSVTTTKLAPAHAQSRQTNEGTSRNRPRDTDQKCGYERKVCSVSEST